MRVIAGLQYHFKWEQWEQYAYPLPQFHTSNLKVILTVIFTILNAYGVNNTNSINWTLQSFLSNEEVEATGDMN